MSCALRWFRAERGLQFPGVHDILGLFQTQACELVAQHADRLARVIDFFEDTL